MPLDCTGLLYSTEAGAGQAYRTIITLHPTKLAPSNEDDSQTQQDLHLEPPNPWCFNTSRSTVVAEFLARRPPYRDRGATITYIA